MSSHFIRALAMVALVSASACGSAPIATPAAAPPASRPARLPSVDPDQSTTVQIDPAIAKACHLPTPHFAFDSSKLGPDGTLDALATCFTTGPMMSRSLKLVGHTDPRGETEYNFDLGQRRAGSVESYLESHGVMSSRIASSSRGELDAVGTDEATWAEDRRVDVLLGD